MGIPDWYFKVWAEGKSCTIHLLSRCNQADWYCRMPDERKISPLRGCYAMTNSWPPYELPRFKAYILAPGVVQIGEIIYHLPEDREEQAPAPPAQFEFIVPVKENSKSAARAAMEGLYRIVFD